MDVETIREYKKEAEREIYARLLELQKTTGTAVTGCNLFSNHIGIMGTKDEIPVHCYFTITMEI